MDTHSIHISGIPSELLKKIDATARKRGKDRSALVRELIEAGLQDKLSSLSKTSFAELLKPIHEEFEESDLSEDDINVIVEKARDDVWNSRKS